MLNDKFDLESLDLIFNRMIKTIDESKNDIFTISEQSRKTFDEMKLELEQVRSKIKEVILENDVLEKKSRLSRTRLAEVSKNFNIYSEAEIQKAYDQANKIQIRYSILQAEERLLRDKRDDLERRMRSLLDTIERADHLVSQVNVVLNYLTVDLKSIRPALENAKMREDYTMKIIEATEEERKRISREIHDGPAQMLANVLLRTDIINRTYQERGIEKALLEIVELKGMVRDALHEVRRIIYDLRPMALDDLGIVPTLKKYLSSVEEYHQGTKVYFQSIGEQTRLDSKYEVAIFRLVQECVNNAIQHGKSHQVWVKLESCKDFINISIKDDGIGFNPQTTKQNSFGLIGMKERVDLLGGEMNLDSVEKQGTRIMFKIPIKTK
ncbi:sensor histidine kinase [Rummeliibacillus stabekisii]|uniref:sensor histidine kinase n=1 Tax=Rummeliibacillus stabekisii TaxID=241244 RepID=UPI001174582C|nr:sensor histidine kinase [Rummeliibacillus stabekisii]MBB5170220.1 two-component system sensor histidine kinase DegS [Rummeliibacillus stabekisii]GEL04478.1 signal transduction histidine-protein kinase/phosphatase DegS [Rummeliibacillus stabekisii]